MVNLIKKNLREGDVMQNVQPLKLANTSKQHLVLNQKFKKKFPKHTLAQQLQAVDALSNLLTKEEKEVFSKVMDEIEEGKYFSND